MRDDAGLSKRLYAACRNGEMDAAITLLNQGADIDAHNDEGYTSLHVAVLFGRADIAELLLSRGADVNATKNDGRTALHLAAVSFHAARMSPILLRHGADPDICDNFGHTAECVARHCQDSSAADLIATHRRATAIRGDLVMRVEDECDVVSISPIAV